MFQRILVPLDGSERAERAIPIAARIARASHGTLVFVRVVLPPFGSDTFAPNGSIALRSETDETEAAKAASYLTDAIATTYADVLAGIQTEMDVISGTVSPTIFTEARLEQVDLIVICSHGESGLKRWVFGSLAQEAVRYSPVPVLVLNEHGVIPSASETDHPLHVLVPLDGSPLSETAIVPTASLIAALAAPGQGALHLMKVVIKPRTYGKFRSRATADHYLLGQRQLEAETYLATLVDRLSQGVLARWSLAITWSVTIASDAAEAIIQVAEQPEESENEEKYDLVAMATHGRGGLRRLLMGSVTEKVLGRTHSPLLIVRPYEVEAQVQQKAETVEGERTEFVMPGLSIYF